MKPIKMWAVIYKRVPKDFNKVEVFQNKKEAQGVRNYIETYNPSRFKDGRVVRVEIKVLKI